MNKRRKPIWGKAYLYVLVASIFLFSACKKDIPVNKAPVSGVMAFNLIPDQANIGFVISNNYLGNSPLPYAGYTGNYLSVYSGNRTIDLYPENADTAAAGISYVFEPEEYYSAFAIGANGNYRNLIIKDNLDSLNSSSDQAFIRYINAVPDSLTPAVTIAENGNSLLDDAASYATVSDFTAISPGDIAVKIIGEGFTADRTITVEKDKVYTILLMGIPNATDTSQAVKIRYIQNGTISPMQ